MILSGMSIRLTPVTSPVMPVDSQRITPKRMLFSESGSNSSTQNAASPKSKAAATSGGGNTPLADSPRALANSLEGGLDDVDLLKIGNSPSAAAKPPKLVQPTEFDRSVKSRASERYPVPNKKRADTAVAEDKENSKPPVVVAVSHKKPEKPKTPHTPVKGEVNHANSPLSPSRSMDSGLNNTKKANDWVFATPEKPISKASSIHSNRKVLGSIERGLDKMKNMLTPRKGRSDGLQTPYGPAVVTGKALCNVSTTSQQNPDNVLNELTRALVAKGIPCQQKGKKESIRYTASCLQIYMLCCNVVGDCLCNRIFI